MTPSLHQPVFKRISKPGSNRANDFLEQRAGRDAVHCTPPPPPNRRKKPGCALASPGPQFPLDTGMNCLLNSWIRLLSSLCHPRPASLNPNPGIWLPPLYTVLFRRSLPFLISGWAARDREEEVKRTWAPPPTPFCSKSGGDYDPQSYHTGAPGQVRTRARQRKVVLVRVSAPMGVFVCLRFCTYVCEPRGVWVGCIRGNKSDVSSETGTPSVFSFYEDA